MAQHKIRKVVITQTLIRIMAVARHTNQQAQTYCAKTTEMIFLTLKNEWKRG